MEPMAFRAKGFGRKTDFDPEDFTAEPEDVRKILILNNTKKHRLKTKKVEY